MPWGPSYSRGIETAGSLNQDAPGFLVTDAVDFLCWHAVCRRPISIGRVVFHRGKRQGQARPVSQQPILWRPVSVGWVVFHRRKGQGQTRPASLVQHFGSVIQSYCHSRPKADYESQANKKVTEFFHAKHLRFAVSENLCSDFPEADSLRCSASDWDRMTSW
jgi:hypothetical protein